MKHQPAVLLALLSAAWLGGLDAAQAQLRSRTTGPGTVIEMQPPIVMQQPGAIDLRPTIVAPTGNSQSLVVGSPPLAKSEAAVDGGDGGCICPDGKAADVEGWCWRRTDPASGYWAKTEKCQR